MISTAGERVPGNLITSDKGLSYRIDRHRALLLLPDFADKACQCRPIAVLEAPLSRFGSELCGFRGAGAWVGRERDAGSSGSYRSVQPCLKSLIAIEKAFNGADPKIRPR